MVRHQEIIKTCVAASLVLSSLAVFAAESGAPPVAAVKPVTDNYFGTSVTDDYRWLENLQDPPVQQWMKGQATYTRAPSSMPSRVAPIC